MTKKRALIKSRRCDVLLAKGDKRPLFYGVPSEIKDLVPTRGIPTNLDSRAYKYFVPLSNALIVHRLKQGGFVSLGKLSNSESGVLPISEPAIHPPTKDHWNLSISAQLERALPCQSRSNSFQTPNQNNTV